MRKALNILSTALVVFAVILAVLMVGTKAVGIEPYVVLSGSMEPTFQTGSVVYVKKAAPDTIREGDVITFRLGDETLATHRVVEVLKKGSALSFRTKGDANNLPDSNPVSSTALVGKVLFNVPKLGTLLEYVHTESGKKVAVAVGIALIALVALPDILFGKKKKEQTGTEVSEETDGTPPDAPAQYERKEETE